VGGGEGGAGGGLDGDGCGRLQAEKDGSGLGTGGNSDSGGPDDAVPDGDVSRAWAEAGGEASASSPRGAKGRRADTRNPHASQN
jgi:hypothetical protein